MTSDKGLYAVMRYSSADDYIEAQRAMTTYADATEIASKRAEEDPDGVCIVVRIIAVIPGRFAPLKMDTKGDA